jgi:hypothetical protein
MRSMLWQLISGGKDQFVVSCVYFPTPWHGPGNSGAEGKSYKDYVSLFDLNMIIHAYGPAVHVHFMKG